MIIELDPSLKETPYRYDYERKLAGILTKTIAPKKRETKWEDFSANPGEKLIKHTLPSKGVDLYHSNYLEYLTQCYATHRSIVITPDVIWYTVLCEIASEIKKTPATYASLFTTDPDNQTEICVPTHDPEYLPLDAIILGLRALVPTDVNLFVQEFSTSGPMDIFAQSAAFADACSPYYRYSTFLCGFPSIDIRGTAEDYDLIERKLESLKAIFTDNPINQYLEKVKTVAHSLLGNLISDAKNVDFLMDILTTKSCGSGGEIQCDGWWPKAMYIKSLAGQKPENFPSHVSRVPYKNLETKREFTLNVGLFYSVKENGFNVPQWAQVVNEIGNFPVKEPAAGFGIEKITITAKSHEIKHPYTVLEDDTVK